MSLERLDAYPGGLHAPSRPNKYDALGRRPLAGDIQERVPFTTVVFDAQTVIADPIVETGFLG